VLAFLNHHLTRKQIEASFVTATLLFYCPRQHTLSYATAGHPPPLLRPATNPDALRKLDAVGSLPLGILPEVTYDTADVTLQPGDTVVLYTDGITEAFDPQQRMFGLAGIEAALTACTGEPTCAITHITEALRRHEAGVQPGDDQTLLVMQRTGEDTGV
jgi:sigma-B regulation protein RsbU (phosphoserine phosphatase)